MVLDGFHVIRRSDRLWSGVSSDLIIEQVLMRSLKTIGGMTRGQFTDIVYETNEQHKEATPARLQADYKDAKKVMEYFMARIPFSVESELVNIHTR